MYLLDILGDRPRCFVVHLAKERFTVDLAFPALFVLLSSNVQQLNMFSILPYSIAAQARITDP